MWINPPIVYDVTRPNSQSTNKITKIVQSIDLTPPCLTWEMAGDGPVRAEIQKSRNRGLAGCG